MWGNISVAPAPGVHLDTPFAPAIIQVVCRQSQAQRLRDIHLDARLSNAWPNSHEYTPFGERRRHGCGGVCTYLHVRQLKDIILIFLLLFALIDKRRNFFPSHSLAIGSVFVGVVGARGRVSLSIEVLVLVETGSPALYHSVQNPGGPGLMEVTIRISGFVGICSEKADHVFLNELKLV